VLLTCPAYAFSATPSASGGQAMESGPSGRMAVVPGGRKGAATKIVARPIPMRKPPRSRGGRSGLPAPMLRVMESIVPSSFLQVIQMAITPVILLSGVGGLMITLTNRMARVVDRTQTLAEQARKAADASEERVILESQLDILWRRSLLAQRAVLCAGLSMLLACMLVMVIFIDAVMAREFVVEMVVIFVASILCLIAALVAFLRDIVVALRALKLDVVRVRATSR